MRQVRATPPGSSPLARGLPAFYPADGGSRRIILARAGFTGQSTDQPRRRSDHPRSRGVYDALGGGCESGQGSSPLARGLPRPGRRWPGELRIIPARAGFTASSPTERRCTTDHPRSRGVYSPPRTSPPGAAGSSPLARGLLRQDGGEGPLGGIIPARAGFTPEGDVHGGPAGDHPRSRGVYHVWAVMVAAWSGSSPLARGLRRILRPPRMRRRIIPARAGFTGPGGGGRARRWDHPRSRGVYVARVSRGLAQLGSSPLARGLRRARSVMISAAGIIPARAGFTDLRRPGGDHPRDHPRSRGVYSRR